ncbi:unnamed protein product [Lasius platythorax]|uniref:Uncharacterized protein n=1 Tax=Lasius platythorax TaxID=488582 RepID=A0AAV2P896_9HYME
MSDKYSTFDSEWIPSGCRSGVGYNSGEYRRLLFAIARKQKRGAKRRSGNRRCPEERTAVARNGEKEQKEKAASAACRKALSWTTTMGKESFFLLGAGPCMDPTTTYETTPASSF